MSDYKFKTMRHMETVRNYLNMCIIEMLDRSELHDQTKLHSPEVEHLEAHTNSLRNVEYGSEEYKRCLKIMHEGIDHHYKFNSHHPQYYPNGVNGMSLFDLIEMLCDWKSASLRHNTGNILKSLEINREFFKIEPQLYEVLKNTILLIESKQVFHKADES